MSGTTSDVSLPYQFSIARQRIRKSTRSTSLVGMSLVSPYRTCHPSLISLPRCRATKLTPKLNQRAVSHHTICEVFTSGDHVLDRGWPVLEPAESLTAVDAIGEHEIPLTALVVNDTNAMRTTVDHHRISHNCTLLYHRRCLVLTRFLFRCSSPWRGHMTHSSAHGNGHPSYTHCSLPLRS